MPLDFSACIVADVTRLAGHATARSRFVREARAAAAVNSKYVIKTFAVDEQPIPYLVMEYIAGKTLQDCIDQMGAFATRDIVRIGADIAEGLAAVHNQGLIHRDSKPANILLQSADRHSRMEKDSQSTNQSAIFNLHFAIVKIADFGLARAADDASLTQFGVITGAPPFMSPEQARGETLDQRSPWAF